MVDDPFKILNISPASTLDEIKKSFRTLIKGVHPDLGGGESSSESASQIIEAYRSALKLTSGREAEVKRAFDLEFSKRFGYNYKEPASKDDFLFYWESILGQSDRILFSTGSDPFYLTFVLLLFQKLQAASEEMPLLTALFSSLLYICRAREAEIDQRGDEDYAADRVREQIIDYFKMVLSSQDYLSFRYNLNSPREELINSIYLRLQRVKAGSLKEELMGALLLILIASDDQFTELWWASKGSNKGALSRL